MKKFRVKFLTGRLGGWGYDLETEKIFKAKDFEDAFYKAKNYDHWHADVCAKIIGIEEIIED